MSSRTKIGRFLRRLAGGALLILVLLFVGRELVLRFGDLRWEEVSFAPGYIGAAAAALFAANGLLGIPYRQLLGHLRGAPNSPDRPRLLPLATVSAAVWVGQMGKYIPGKVPSVATLVWLLYRRGVPKRAGLAAAVMVSALWIGLALAMASPLWLQEPIRDRMPQAWLWGTAVAAVGLATLHPRVLRPVADFVLRRLGRDPLGPLPSVRDYLVPAAFLALYLALNGVALWLAARGVTGVTASHLGLFVSATALAYAAGFLSLFAPAGIGVREGVLLLVLGTVLPRGADAVAVTAVRLLMILVELALAGVGLVLLRRGAPPSAP